MYSKDLAGVLAIAMSLGIPIVAIVSAIIATVKKSNNAREIRRAIIENHTDVETVKYLIEEPEKKRGNNPYPSLRWGCVLIGLGLGALIDFLLHLHPSDSPESVYFWILLAFGCGIGLLVAFLIEYKLMQSNMSDAAEQSQQG